MIILHICRQFKAYMQRSKNQLSSSTQIMLEIYYKFIWGNGVYIHSRLASKSTQCVGSMLMLWLMFARVMASNKSHSEHKQWLLLENQREGGWLPPRISIHTTVYSCAQTIAPVQYIYMCNILINAYQKECDTVLPKIIRIKCGEPNFVLWLCLLCENIYEME